MTSVNEDHISERQLVRKAAVQQSARQQLREELLPYVTRATKEFMQKRNIKKNRESELVEVGMTPFDQIFNIYLKNAGDRDEEEGHFYKYYIWWMRQTLVEYLETNP